MFMAITTSRAYADYYWESSFRGEASPPPISRGIAGESEWTCPATINHQIAAQRARGESPRPVLTSLTTPDVARNALVGFFPLDRRTGVVARSPSRNVGPSRPSTDYFSPPPPAPRSPAVSPFPPQI